MENKLCKLQSTTSSCFTDGGIVALLVAMLRKIKVPVLLTGGSKDMIRQKHMKYIADCIPGAELLIFSGEKHESYIVHSQKIAEVIIEKCVEQVN